MPDAINPPDTAATTVRVHLAEAPTDVLVWLVEHADGWDYSTLRRIADNAAPADADDRYRSTHDALHLLHQAGYVEGVMVEHGGIALWRATDLGRAAVEEATAAIQPQPKETP